MSDKMRRVVVYHDWYGCETGCCGHRARLYEGTKEIASGDHFEFIHPDSDENSKRAFAQQVAERNFPGEQLDYQSCEISSD